jgi:uncharacterized protein YndB with AHSA1/START domain
MNGLPIVKSIAIAAPLSHVWRSVTEPDMMQGWMSDEAMEITLKPQVGSPIVIRGLLHGLPFENHGTILRFEPEQVFAYDYWSTLSQSRLADLPENRTAVRFDLSPRERATLLTVTLSNFAEPSIGPHANLYWGGTLPVLKAAAERTATDRDA